jgi:hypothetical protein
MSALPKILPGTGRWQPEGLTEGAQPLRQLGRRAPSTIRLRRLVPLPVPGRIKE